ncbi:MAG TPA: bifunctional adenosylcobinamide kinase/adenosylcobinamide-phosphate guanylyltransferase [Acidimicrobiales bacterium]|nr:bifunctional adenosylcobinamide kinase/adenosylcobinamide-phosphate guanylyltransferase [Acidimicrobiales bacterium]
MSLALVLGGTRSGKSAVAERLAVEAAVDGLGVTYVATGAATDSAMEARIAAHRLRRPAGWATVEAGPGADLPAVLGLVPGVVLLDSLGTWVAGHHDLDPDGDALCDALAGRDAPSVVVSEEVGLAIHPASEVGRRFVDVIGTLNQQVAAIANRVVLVVAGRCLEL